MPRSKAIAHLISVVGRADEETYEIADTLVIGRGSQAGARVGADDVSRSHAVIRSTPDGFMVEDLDSRNGTRVNGDKIKSRRLGFGDKVQVGAHTIFVFTHQTQLEARVVREQQMRSVGRLATGIAHEYNNALQTVRSNTEYLLALSPDEPIGSAVVRECLDDIDAASARAADLTEQLVGLARRGKYEQRPVDISQLVRDVAAFVAERTAQSVEVQGAFEAALAVVGDGSQLQQVFVNLLTNAYEAMPGGGKLHLRTAVVAVDAERALACSLPAPGRYVLVTVRDSGVGMDTQTRERAFEPFFTTKDPGQGPGLGLASVCGIVENHGGNVQVTSRPAHGTTVRVYLPLSDSPHIEGERGKTWAGATLVSHAVLAAGKASELVLLVDDEEAVRNATARMLNGLGYDVLCAANGAEALELHERYRDHIRLVVLDLLMPRLSGRETYRRLRAANSQATVIIASGYVDQDTADQLESEGVDAILRKPFTRRTLTQVVAGAHGV